MTSEDRALTFYCRGHYTTGNIEHTCVPKLPRYSSLGIYMVEMLTSATHDWDHPEPPRQTTCRIIHSAVWLTNGIPSRACLVYPFLAQTKPGFGEHPAGGLGLWGRGQRLVSLGPAGWFSQPNSQKAALASAQGFRPWPKAVNDDDLSVNSDHNAPGYNCRKSTLLKSVAVAVDILASLDWEDRNGGSHEACWRAAPSDRVRG